MSRTRLERDAILDKPSPAFILTSRILIGMMALLLLILPSSERYNALDSFPHGRDTELSFLAFFALSGLILLFLRTSRKRLRKLLTIRFLLFSIIPQAMSFIPDSRHLRGLADYHRPPLPGFSLDTYSLPLQI